MNNNQNNNIKNIIDFSDIDINDINISSVKNETKDELKVDENGLYNNLDDIDFEPKLNIKIFGIGGAGNNIIEHMAKNSDIDPTMLYAINTDCQVLRKMSDIKCSKILIGKNVTKGFGSGSDPVVGEKAANENKEFITKLLKGVDLLFIVSGMGKGTGTGASPVIASIAKELNILTISIVNVPSIQTESMKIYNKGLKGIANLKKYVDGLATIDNDKILGSNLENESLFNCFKKANQVISDTIRDLIHTVNIPSHINIDFNDIRNFFKEKTHFQITNCEFESNENSKEIFKQKISSTLFEDKVIGSQKAILTLKLNTNVPSTFITDIRNVIDELTGNKEFELTYAIDYSDDISFAKLSILIATNYFDTNEITNNNEEYILDLQQKINEFEQSDKNVAASNQDIQNINASPNTNINKVNNNEDVDGILDDINQIENNIMNDNPNKAVTEKEEYNLDDINFNKEYDSLNKTLIETKEIIKQQTTQYNLSSLESNQPMTSSTKLNNFISKTLPLFKNNFYNKNNDNK